MSIASEITRLTTLRNRIRTKLTALGIGTASDDLSDCTDAIEGITAQAAQTITPSGSAQTIASGKYLTGAQTVEAVVTSNLTAANIVSGVVVKVGTATDDDSVASVTGTASGGGGSSLYPLGGTYSNSTARVTLNGNHFRMEYVGLTTDINGFCDLTGIYYAQVATNRMRTQSTWFTIPSGATVEMRYTNIVNASGLIWNANFKKADTTTSLSYGIGNDTHLTGETVTVTPTSNDDIGYLMIYISQGTVVPQIGDILEFDVSMSVNGVRYF